MRTSNIVFSRPCCLHHVLLIVVVQFLYLSRSHSQQSAAAGEYYSECSLYLAPSTIPQAGRGIIAGKDYSLHEGIENAVSLTMKSSFAMSTALANYVFGVDDPDYSMMLFGPGALYNSIPLYNVHHFW